MTNAATAHPSPALAVAAPGVTPLAARTFIRAAEVWVPSEDGTLLELAGGLFGNAPRFGALSRTMCFGRGEGLPGRAWDDGQPRLLKQFEGSYFRRIAAAAAAGLTCGIAVPWFRDGQLLAVLVLFCGDVAAHAGAIELWHNDPRVSSDMTLVDGYYGTSPAALEALSRDTFLPRGTGLPGLAWQRGGAVFIDDLGASPRFLRADATVPAGIHRGLAFPCATLGDGHWVLSFLSAPDTPIARRIERWAPAPDGLHLQRTAVAGEAGADPSPLVLDGGAGTVGLAFATGAPVVCERAATEPGALGAVAVSEGLGGFVALPVVDADDDAVAEVVVLYF